MTKKLEIRPTDCLVIIDPQVDFCPGGALEVPEGDEVMEPINRLAAQFPHVVITQDWHPADQISFASTHGAAPFSLKEVAYGPQVMWPDHCIAGTPGADLHPAIAGGAAAIRAELVLRKGYNRDVDSYSAFFENDKVTQTGLDGWLKQRGYQRLFFCGLAFDFCVRYSAIDAKKLGYEALVFVDATRSIDLDDSVRATFAEFDQLGIPVLTLNQI